MEMKMIRKILLCAGTGLLLSTGSLQSVPGGIFHMDTAYGAESSIIETMSIKFNTTFGDPEEIPQPQITISGSGVSIGDIYYKTEYENWKPGKKVRMEITVDAAQGKYFPVSLGRSKCRVTGADFVSAKALDNTTMQVKVNYTPVTVLGDTALAGWSSHDSEKAVWKKVDYAPGYTLTLYGNDKVVKRMTVTSNSVSLKEYMTDPDKIYYYQVKAVPVTAEQKKYLKEGEFITSQEQDIDDSAEEEKEKEHAACGTGPGVAGSLKGDNFVMPDGTLAVNTWKLVGGIWYYFNAEGNRTRGWFQYGGKWYYFDGNGLLWSSFFVTLVAKKIVLINLCCRPCFIWGSITIITVWTNMIIINVCKFFYLLIECFLCCKLIQICAFILQGIEVTLHRCIVVRISCFAHALCHIYRFAEFGKCFGRIL